MTDVASALLQSRAYTQSKFDIKLETRSLRRSNQSERGRSLGWGGPGKGEVRLGLRHTRSFNQSTILDFILFFLFYFILLFILFYFILLFLKSRPAAKAEIFRTTLGGRLLDGGIRLRAEFRCLNCTRLQPAWPCAAFDSCVRAEPGLSLSRSAGRSHTVSLGPPSHVACAILGCLVAHRLGRAWRPG